VAGIDFGGSHGGSRPCPSAAAPLTDVDESGGLDRAGLDRSPLLLLERLAELAVEGTEVHGVRDAGIVVSNQRPPTIAYTRDAKATAVCATPPLVQPESTTPHDRAAAPACGCRIKPLRKTRRTLAEMHLRGAGARRPRDGRPGCDGRHGRFRNPPLQAMQRARQRFSRQPRLDAVASPGLTETSARGTPQERTERVSARPLSQGERHCWPVAPVGCGYWNSSVV
jgi:hypothetical protein